jgi:hypothetical protein
MPLEIQGTNSTLLITRQAFERSGLTRSALDARLNLTDDEFRMEGNVIAIGPLPPYGWLSEFVAELESMGLVYFDDFFELSGNWPEWVQLYVMPKRTGEGSAD